MHPAADTEPGGAPGLLPWQVYFLAFVLGIFSFRHPVESVAALGLLWAVDHVLRAPGVRANGLAVALLLGMAYAWSVAPQPPAEIPAFMLERTPVAVEARVDRVEPRPGQSLRILLADVTCTPDNGPQTELPGKVVWQWRWPDRAVAPGDTVRFFQRLAPIRGYGNPGQGDYAWYWGRQGVFWRTWSSGGKGIEVVASDGFSPGSWKAALRQRLTGLVPETPGGALVLTLATGDRFRLEPETMETLRDAGLAHILALSGLHVGLVALFGVGLAYGLGWLRPSIYLRVPRPKLAVLLAAPLVLAYVWLGQPSASLIRAACMFGFWGGLLLMGRGRVLLDGLFFALALIVAVSPLSVFDMSLQMSGVAVAGIAALFPLLRRAFLVRGGFVARLVGYVAGLLGISLSVNLAMLPVMAWYFGMVQPDFLFNLLWLPGLGFAVMPLAVAGAVLAPFAWTAGAAAHLLGWAAGITDWMLSVVARARDAGWTPSVAVYRLQWPQMLGYWLLLGLGAALAGRAVSSRGRNVLLALAAALLLVPAGMTLYRDGRDRVRLEVIDVGQGQSVLITAPGGGRWLVDGGGNTSPFMDIGESVVGPYVALGRLPRLDGVVMSHEDSDHSKGLSHILGRFSVGRFVYNGTLPGGELGRRMRRAIHASGLDPEIVRAGDLLDLGRGLVLEVLHPSDLDRTGSSNNRSLALRLVWRGTPLALLFGDLERGGLRPLLTGAADLSAQVLVLPHHGSVTSLSPALYDRVGPRLALVSCGYLNGYGFPSPEVVRAMADRDVPLLATALHGLLRVEWAAPDALFSVVEHGQAIFGSK